MHMSDEHFPDFERSHFGASPVGLEIESTMRDSSTPLALRYNDVYDPLTVLEYLKTIRLKASSRRTCEVFTFSAIHHYNHP